VIQRLEYLLALACIHNGPFRESAASPNLTGQQRPRDLPNVFLRSAKGPQL
jgi:hypothetical protein